MTWKYSSLLMLWNLYSHSYLDYPKWCNMKRSPYKFDFALNTYDSNTLPTWADPSGLPLISLTSHWSPSHCPPPPPPPLTHWSPFSLVPHLINPPHHPHPTPHPTPLSLVHSSSVHPDGPHCTGPQSHWSPSYWSPISLVLPYSLIITSQHKNVWFDLVHR